MRVASLAARMYRSRLNIAQDPDRKLARRLRNWRLKNQRPKNQPQYHIVFSEIQFALHFPVEEEERAEFSPRHQNNLSIFRGSKFDERVSISLPFLK